MKPIFGLVVLTFVLLVFPNNTVAQNSNSAAQTAEDLRAQIYALEAQEAALRARASELDEAMKPENIQNSLAGVGSTRPEELREYRRKQLSSEKKSVVYQLEQLAVHRAQLETALQNAQNLAYQQSAEGTPLNRIGITNYTSGSRLMIVGLLGCVALIGIAGLFVLIRRQQISGNG